MPGLEEWIPVVLAIVTPMAGGIGWWFKVRRDDRLAREAAYIAQIKDLQQQVKDEQQENKAQLQERLRYEVVRRESVDQTMQLLRELTALLRAGKGLT
jgi:hypothetical protein